MASQSLAEHHLKSTFHKEAAIHNDVTHTQAFVAQERLAAGVDKRPQFLVHIGVHVAGNCLIQNEIYAIAAQLKAEQENGYVVPCHIFQVRRILIQISSAIWLSAKRFRL